MRIVLATLLGCLVSLASLTAQDERRPIPASDQQRSARARIAAAYDPRLDGAEHDEKVAVVDEYLEQARDREDVALRYAFLDEARKLAIALHDGDRAKDAAELLRDAFETPRRFVFETVEAAEKGAMPGPQLVTIKRAYLEIAEQAVVDGDIKLADLAAKRAGGRTTVRHDDLGPRLKQLTSELPGLRGLARRADKARKLLDDAAATPAPVDVSTEAAEARAKKIAAAHRDVGLWDLFRNEWEAGLKHLAAGDDDALRELATLALAEPDDWEAQFDLGQRWERAIGARTVKPVGRLGSRFRDRARACYGRALEQTDDDLDRDPIQRRLARLEAAADEEDAKSSAAPRLVVGRELLTNGDCEAGDQLPGWTELSGDWHAGLWAKRGKKSSRPHRGKGFFSASGPKRKTATLEQAVDLRSVASRIDRGGLSVRLEAMLQTYRQDPGDIARIGLLFFDANGDELDDDRFEHEDTTDGAWVRVRETVVIPRGARQVHVRLTTIRRDGRGQKSSDGHFDDVSLKLERRGA